jgi:rubrerythrin
VVKEALGRLDALMNRLIEADQTGSGMDPLNVANELGQIRQLLAESPAVIPAKGGQRHFRCEACGTVVHGADAPARCPTCGATKFFAADIEQPFVESGAG